MTTHEAQSLAPNTLVFHSHKNSSLKQLLEGAASPEHPGQIRIIWHSIGEADSIIRITDRVMLSSIKIVDATTENDL